MLLSYRKVGGLVACLHGLLLFLIAYSAVQSPLPAPMQKRCVVQTIQLQEKKQAVISSVSSSVAASKQAVKPQKIEKKKAVKKVAGGEIKKEVPLSTAKPSKHLVAQALESVGKIQMRKDTIGGEIPPPSPQVLQNLKIEGLGSFGTDYAGALGNRLKLLLTMPEYGEVEIALTLERSGRVTHMAILHTESQRNKTYMEKMLLSLSFPPFGASFVGEERHTFTIKFSHDL